MCSIILNYFEPIACLEGHSNKLHSQPNPVSYCLGGNSLQLDRNWYPRIIAPYTTNSHIIDHIFTPETLSNYYWYFVHKLYLSCLMWFIKCVFFFYLSWSICYKCAIDVLLVCSMIFVNHSDSYEVNPPLFVCIVKIKGLWVEVKAIKFTFY